MNASTDGSSVPGPEAGRLDDQLCFALYAATNAITRLYRPLLADLKLTYPQFLVLVILWEHKKCTTGDIARKLQLATHAISPIIDRLETAGFVARATDQHDGRVVNVVLTAEGAELEPRAAAVQHSIRCATELEDSGIAELRAQLIELAAEFGQA